jgi:hypothetical protein
VWPADYFDFGIEDQFDKRDIPYQSLIKTWLAEKTEMHCGVGRIDFASSLSRSAT